MTTAYYSTVLNHPLETVWTLIRDFNNYPAYIEGVSESAVSYTHLTLPTILRV